MKTEYTLWRFLFRNLCGLAVLGFLGGLTPLFATDLLHGIDVSHYQTRSNSNQYLSIDWEAVRNATPAQVFAFVKASEGNGTDTTDTDVDFVQSINGAFGTKPKIFVGAYHLCYPNLNPGTAGAQREAAHFITVAGPYLTSGYLRPALDIEPANAGDFSKLSGWIDSWMQMVKAEIKHRSGQDVNPVIYTTRSVANSLSASLIAYPLWIADKNAPQSLVGDITPWPSWAFHQYLYGEAGGSSPGVFGPKGCDLDVFNGTTNDISKLVIGNSQSSDTLIVTNPEGVPVCNLTIMCDGIPLGRTDDHGKTWWSSFISGVHYIQAQIQHLFYGGYLDLTHSSSGAISFKTTRATAQSNITSVSVPLQSDGTCVSLNTKFGIGDVIEVFGTETGLRARYPDPCSDSWKVMPDLSVGTIIGAAQCCNGYVRWKIRYDALQGIDVWSAEGEPSTGQLFLRKKQNSTCSYSLAPGHLDLDTSGAAASGFNLNTGSSCSWTATSNLDWISITTNASGTGSAQVTFSVSANDTPYSRTGNIVAGDQIFVVTQPGNGSATSGWALTVASSNPNSGVGVTVSPNDTNGLGSGVTPFTRNYNAYTRVQVTAPAGVGSTTFNKWQRDGVDWSTSTDTDLAMEGNHTMTAIYIPIPDRYLAVFISPQQVVDAGAKWYLQGTGPYDSGQAIGPFNAGTTIQSGFSYTPIAGWIAPPDQSVTIANSGPTIVRVNYTLAPTLSLSTNQISVGSGSGGANLLVTNTGGGALNWSASTPDNWITLETPSGSTPGGANASLSFLFQPNASVGSRSGTVTVTANGATASPQSIIITQRDQVATPTISPNGGSYTGSIQVALACTSSDAAIHYTTDGSDPTLDSDIYSTPITLTSSTLVKAKAMKDGSDDSNTASASFSFPPSPTPTPVPTPTGTPTTTATPTVTPTPTATPAFPVQLGNIATRLKIGAGDNAMIGGFIITGSQQKAVIVRGIGPSLGALGVPGALADPIIEVHGSTGELLATNDNWMDDQPDRLQHVIDNGLAPTNNRESAKWGILNPGNYTVVVRGKDNGVGVGLFEVYDVDPTVDSKLANISTRGFVNAGDNAMIGGIIISGSSPAKVLFRAIGPSLTNVGVASALQDPTLELRDKQGSLMISNDNWRETQEAAIIATTIPPMDDRESAILTTLPPGQYTAIVRGKDNSTGVALVEAYQLP
jgi:GH25 family lysozyme M1 (1,4-beta-N-acetylmuramidase)